MIRHNIGQALEAAILELLAIAELAKPSAPPKQHAWLTQPDGDPSWSPPEPPLADS